MNTVFLINSLIVVTFILAILVLLNLRLIVLNIKRLILSRYGYGSVKILGNDKRVHKHFIDLKSESLPALLKKYGLKAVAPECSVFEDGCITYYYKSGYIEPINFYEPTITNVQIGSGQESQTVSVKVSPFSLGTSNSLADKLIKSEIHAVDLDQLKKNTWILKLLTGALILSGAAALFAFSADDKLTQVLALAKGASIIVS